MTDTILLVDDEEGIRKVLSISLADSGYDILTASNGEDTGKKQIYNCQSDSSALMRPNASLVVNDYAL